MNISGLKRCCLGMLLSLLCCALGAEKVTAQEPPAQPEMPLVMPRPAVQESTPLRLVDEKGNLVAVPGMTLEEFLRIIQREKPPGNGLAPVGTIEEMTITGKVVENRAECTVSMRARVQGTGWCTIPVRMGKMVLRAAPKYSEGQQQVLRWEEGGYVWQIKGGEKTEAKIDFEAFLMLSNVGDETRLAATLPRANASSLKLTVPGKSQQAMLRGGEGIVSTSAAGDGTDIQVVGGAGDFQLGWHRVENMANAPVALLESSGDIVVKVEGQYRVSSEARLKVRSFGEAVSSFRVKLPPAMELQPFTSTGYSVEVVQDLPRGMSATPEQLAKASQIVEVKLDRPAAGVAEVRLVAVLVPDEKRTAPLEPARFEIEGAVRQRGTLDAVVDGDWSLQWTEDSSVRRVDAIADASSAVRHSARFEYFRQPCGLKMQVVPRPTRVHVEPTYVIFLDKHRMRLEATLKYRIRGARTDQLPVDLGDWKFSAVGPDSLVEVDPAETQKGQAIIKSLQPGGASGTLDLKLEAQQAVTDPLARVEFTLPRPKADVIAPATVIIVPADNMELTLDPNQTQGLAADVLTTNVPLPMSQLPPLVFRDLGGAAPAKFAAEVKLQSRRTSASSTAAVRVGQRSIEVEQRVKYLVQYEPQSRFEWWVPRVLLDGGLLQVTDGSSQPVTLVRVATEESTASPAVPPPPLVDKPMTAPAEDSSATTPSEAETEKTPAANESSTPTENESTSTPAAPKIEDTGWVRCRVETLSPVLGSHEFILRYSLDVPRIDSVIRPVVEASFVQPITDTPVLSEGLRLTVTQSDELQVEPSGGAVLRWERVSRREFRGVLPSERQKVGLRIIPLERSKTPGILVHRLFVQSWLAGNEREDRAVFRLTAAESKVRFRLPPDAGKGALTIAVDGRELKNWGETDRGEIVVDLPADKLNVPCVVEFWYDFPQGRLSGNWLGANLDPPAVVGVSSVRQIMWEVVTGADVHLLVDPLAYVPEMNWDWRGIYFGRQASMSQGELEDWAGASQQSPLPESANHYLFQSFGRSPQLQLSLIRRRWLILFASLAALTCGLALAYIPALRSVAMLTVLGVALVAGALVAPEMTAILGQAAIAGLIAAAVAMVLRSLLGPRPSPTAESVRRARTESSLIQGGGSHGGRRPVSTTATAAAGFLPEAGP